MCYNFIMPNNTNSQFMKPDSPVLVRVANAIPIDQIDSVATKQMIDRMLNVAYGEQTDRAKPVLVGLAAPQIGLSVRIILVDVAADGHGESGDLRVFVNPEITWASSEQTEWYEACYSTAQVAGIVTRPNSVRIRALDMDGCAVVGEYAGYIARIFQHEIDHLDGKEFVTHIPNTTEGNSKLHWVEDDEFPAYRNNEGWRNWPNKCPRERWNQIKGITAS
jgi:peptide deformylase